MTSGTLISEEDARAMVRLLGEVASNVSDDHTQMKRCLMDGLCQLLDAHAWAWTMGVRGEPGKPQVWVGFLHHGFTSEQFTAYMKALENPKMVPLTVPFVSQLEKSGTQVTMRRQDMDPEGLSYGAGIGEYWEQAGIGPIILCGHPVDRESVSGTALYRSPGARAFGERERQVMHVMLEEVDWLHQQGWPEDRGVNVPKLSPRQRVVLNLLLDGMRRQDIAQNLGLSEHTVSGYIKGIHQYFNVSSQPELMNRFLS